MASFQERIIGAARLDPAIYEEVEADQGAMGQALAVVALSALSAGIGAIFSGFLPLLLALVGALVGWFFQALIIFVVGGMLLPESNTQADAGQVLRTVGFAASPGLLRFLGLIPFIGRLISLVIGIWILVATVIAVRQALDYTSTPRAVLVCVIAWVAYMIFAVLPIFFLGAFAAAIS